MGKKLPVWIKTSDDYEGWKQGGSASDYQLQSQQRRPLNLYIIIGIICLTVFCGGIFIYVKGTPRYSLYQFRSAVSNRDCVTALKYLDIDSIVDNLMEECIANQGVQSAGNEREHGGRNLGNMMVSAMLPAMKNTAKSALKTSITSNDKSNLDTIKKGSLWDLNIDTDGHIATVINKTDSSFKFIMAEADGYWKIVDIIKPYRKDSTLARRGNDILNQSGIHAQKQ